MRADMSLKSSQAFDVLSWESTSASSPRGWSTHSDSSPLSRHPAKKPKPAIVPKLPIGEMNEKMHEFKAKKKVDRTHDKLRQRAVLQEETTVANEDVHKKCCAQLHLLLMDPSRQMPAPRCSADV